MTDNKFLKNPWLLWVAVVAFVVVGLMFSADPKERDAARKAAEEDRRQAAAMASDAKEEQTETKPGIEIKPPIVPLADLASHRGFYKITLKSATGGSGVTGASGSMAYAFADQCDGWTVENTTALRVSYGERGGSDTLWRFLSWEAKDGKSYRYRVRQEQDGNVVEKVRGSATLGGDKGGMALFVEPEETEMKLASGTLLPSAHVQGLLGAARKGETVYSRIMFDGAGLDNPYEVNAILGRSKGTDNPLLEPKGGEKEQVFWRAHMAFFSVKSKAAVPTFELMVNYRNDGIADLIHQDFGDFALTMKLEKLEFADPADCR